MSTKPAVILITGCSTGFGRELALGEPSLQPSLRTTDVIVAALSAGLRVIATARRLETLGGLEEKGSKALKLDVTSSTDELKAFANEAVSLL